jgi:hypothetical protein
VSHFDTAKVQFGLVRQSVDGPFTGQEQNYLSIKKAQQVMQIFIVTLIFVVGAVTAVTVTQEPPVSREPASFSPNIEPKTLPKEIEVVRLHCDHNSYSVSRVSQIRLSGKICSGGLPRAAVKRSRIRNLSTNSEAMVFFLEKANHFTTDLIPVQSGINSIEILNDFDDGQSQTQTIDVQIQ